MLTLFKKLLGKPKPQQTPVTKRFTAPPEAGAPIPTVEVAHLSLAAIIDRLPEDLQSLVRQHPDVAATVALPIHTIVKQLPTGAVKITLATLHRQAPAGVFAPLPPGDKRTVSVPLAEIFRHVSPITLKRRMDQRSANLPPADFDLFGNAANPYAIGPADENQPATLVIDEPDEPPVAPRFTLKPRSSGPGARVIPPPADYLAPTPHRVTPAVPAPAPKPKSDLPPLRMPLAPLMAGWPEEIQGELAALNGSASVLLPVADVTAGLAKGKVSFTWGEMRGFIEPTLEFTSTVDEAALLTLPLKLVAPAFLAASNRPKQTAKKVTVGEDIPAMFYGGKVADILPEPEAATEAAPTVEPAPVADAPLAFKLSDESAPVAVEEPAAREATAVEEVDPISETEPAAEVAPIEEIRAIEEAGPAAEVAPLEESAPDAESVDVEEAAPPESAQVAEPAPSPVVEPEAGTEPDTTSAESESSPVELLQFPPAPTTGRSPAGDAKTPATIGAVLGEPDRQHWTPGEIVSRLPQLPGVAGAVVALQEGLLVAHSLPEDVKGEVVAAFLPQIFARLNQYAGEMKLGEVDDLLFTTRGAHCQIYRFGEVFFAVLGKRGESLPWHDLRVIADELAQQTQPS